jgi:hypothetical protein
MYSTVEFLHGGILPYQVHLQSMNPTWLPKVKMEMDLTSWYWCCNICNALLLAPKIFVWLLEFLEMSTALVNTISHKGDLR